MKKIAAILLLLLVLCAGAACKLYLIGEPIDGSLLGCHTETQDNHLKLYVSTPASAIALRGWKYRRVGDTLYISARKVLVSSLFSDGTYQTTLDISLISRIYLGGSLIWSHPDRIQVPAGSE